MKHIIIKDFGPLRDVDMELDRMNLIIGLQSSGKSCAMIIACYCSWVEKRIVLRQSAKDFMQGSNFIDLMTAYYHCKGYVHENTIIKYRSRCMEFSYDHQTRTFTHRWREGRWEYRRPKVTYVPAERNLVSLVTNWNKLETSYDNILEFKEDWDTARSFMKKEPDILGTGISYEYNEITGLDSVITPEGIVLELTNSSSGMQSLIPQFVHLDYLNRGIYEAEKSEREKTLADKLLTKNLLETLYAKLLLSADQDADKESVTVIHKGGNDYVFMDKTTADVFVAQANQLLHTDHAEVFLEEPECNLFPPTQFQLTNWIIDMLCNEEHQNVFFIATHSPYILSHLLQEKLDGFKLFFTYPSGEGRFGIRTADEETIQQIYDNGSDAFFNFDTFV